VLKIFTVLHKMRLYLFFYYNFFFNIRLFSLQEAGITLGEGGVLKTADGQILTNEEGNPITSNLKPATAPAVTPATPAPRNNLVGDAVAAAGLGAEELGSGFQLNTSAVTSAGPTAMADLSTITGQTQV
jgi:hypothetical protein